MTPMRIWSRLARECFWNERDRQYAQKRQTNVSAMMYDSLLSRRIPTMPKCRWAGRLRNSRRSRTGAPLIIDLCDGEPADYAPAGVRRQQAMRAAQILGAIGSSSTSRIASSQTTFRLV